MASHRLPGLGSAGTACSVSVKAGVYDHATLIWSSFGSSRWASVVRYTMKLLGYENRKSRHSVRGPRERYTGLFPTTQRLLRPPDQSSCQKHMPSTYRDDR